VKNQTEKFDSTADEISNMQEQLEYLRETVDKNTESIHRNLFVNSRPQTSGPTINPQVIIHQPQEPVNLATDGAPTTDGARALTNRGRDDSTNDKEKEAPKKPEDSRASYGAGMSWVELVEEEERNLSLAGQLSATNTNQNLRGSQENQETQSGTMGHHPTALPKQGTQNQNIRDTTGPPPPFPASQDVRASTNASLRRGDNRYTNRDQNARDRPYNQVAQSNNMDPRGPPPPFSTARDERGRTSLRRYDDRNQDRDRDRSHNHRYRNAEETSRDASRNRERDDSVPTRENGSLPHEPRGNHPFVFDKITNREQRDPSPRDQSQTRGPRQVRNNGFAIDQETGAIRIVEDFIDVPYRSDRQIQRENRRHERDLEEARKQLVLFDIPTRDANGEYATKESDQRHAVRIFRELIRGGFRVRNGDIVEVVRQWKNTRHPEAIPMTIKLITAEVRDEAFDAAMQCGLAGARRPRQGDSFHGRIGYLRRSLTARERKNIKKNREWREGPQGIAMREILNREENSRTTEEEWLNIQLEGPEEGEEVDQGNHFEDRRQMAPGPTLDQRMREIEEENRQLREERDLERNRNISNALKRAKETNNNNNGRGQDNDQRDQPSNFEAPPPLDVRSIPTQPVAMMATNNEETTTRAQMSATPELFVNLTDNLYLGNPNLRTGRVLPTRRTEADGAQETNNPHPATQATSIPEPSMDQMDDDEVTFT